MTDKSTARDEVLAAEISRCAAMWVSFVVFCIFLSVTIAGLTHDNILINFKIHVPLIGSDLPLRSFSVVAPLLIIGFQIYFLMQYRLIVKIVNSNEKSIKYAIERNEINNSLFLQVFCAPGLLRPWIVGVLAPALPWATLVVAPLLILLLLEFQLLPLHEQWLIFLQRAYVLFACVVLVLLWPTSRRLAMASLLLILGGVLFFSMVASFPGDLLYKVLSPRLTTFMFEGKFDVGAREASSFFSNRIVLTDKNLPNVSLRNRDLRGAIFDGSNLEAGDFAGSNLAGASFRNSKLKGSRFNSSNIERPYDTRTDLKGVDFSGAELSNAWFDYADMIGSSMETAVLTDARAVGSDMTAASLRQTLLERTDFTGALLIAASLSGATIKSTKFIAADLQATTLIGIDLSTADLTDVIHRNLALENDDFDRQDSSKQNALAKIYHDISCALPVAPYAAQGLINNRNLTHIGQKGAEFLSNFRIASADTCPGAIGLTRRDLRQLKNQLETE